MIDLREYKDVLAQRVAQEDRKEDGREWSVQSIEQIKAVIRWGEYTFCLEVDEDGWLNASAEDGTLIEYAIISDCDDRGDIEYYMGYMVEAIADHARETHPQ